MYSSVKLSSSTLPFLLHWLHWPRLWALIVSFWGLKDARWALDVLKRQIVKPVCEWQITSLAFLWLEKTLNKLSMCSTARWIVHLLHSCMWIVWEMLHRLCTRECLLVCVRVCARSVKCCLYSQCGRPGVHLCDRIGADQCSLTEQLTWGKTQPLSLSAFPLLRSFSLWLFLSDPDRGPLEPRCSALPLPFLFQFSFHNPICLFLYHALCKDTLWEGSL